MATSDFFANVFSTECTESTTGVVELRNSPPEGVFKVLRWVYTGEIEFADSEFMTLYYLSRYLGIWQLEAELREELEILATPETILGLCEQCYEYSYPMELHLLEPYLGRFLDSLPMARLSEVLDVVTFSEVLRASDLPNERKIAMINGFLGNYQPDSREQSALIGCLTRDAKLKALVVGKNYAWAKPEWIRSLH
jgi:hypothetical protein